MKIAVIGSTGVLGRNVIPRLLDRGHAVHALVRREEQATMLRRVGVSPVIGDIFDIGSLTRVTHGCDVAMHLATSIPRDYRDWSTDARVRREGTQNLLNAVRASGVKRYVQQSIALLYGEQGATVVDETTPLQPSGITQPAADMESYVRASGLDWRIARGGLFYGPGTGREEDWKLAVRSDDFRLPGDGNALMSLIHVADMASAIVLCAEVAPTLSVYNIVDDEPVSYRGLYEYVAAREGRPEPRIGGPVFLPSLACSNKRAKKDLNWSPAYPTFRSALATSF